MVNEISKNVICMTMNQSLTLLFNEPRHSYSLLIAISSDYLITLRI